MMRCLVLLSSICFEFMGVLLAFEPYNMLESFNSIWESAYFSLSLEMLLDFRALFVRRTALRCSSMSRSAWAASLRLEIL